MGAAIAAVLGIIAASPLNVAIDWLPPVADSWRGRRAERRSRGRCSGRRHVPTALLLVPLAGWAARRGRCPACGRSASVRRPVVELLVGGLAALAWQRFGDEPLQAAGVAVFAAVILALGVMDLETQFLPDRMVLPATAAALAVSPFWPGLAPWDGATGAAVGYAAFLPFAWYGDRTGRDIMGWGDVKFGGLLGAVLGLQMLLLGLYLGILLGGVAAAGILLFRSRKRRPRVIAYGTFLAAGGLIALYYGRPIVDWAVANF